MGDSGEVPAEISEVNDDGKVNQRNISASNAQQVGNFVHGNTFNFYDSTRSLFSGISPKESGLAGDSISATHFQDSGGTRQDNIENGKASLELSNLDEASNPVAHSEANHLDDREPKKETKRTFLRRRKWGRKSYMAFGIFSIIAVAAAVGISMGLAESHKHSHRLTTSDIPQTNSTAQSSTVKGPSSNAAETTSISSIRTLSTSYTSAAAASTSTCTSNCIPSITTTASTPSSANIQAPVTTAAPTTKTRSSSREVGLCTSDTDCSSHLACDYAASTCFLCTYATWGMSCSGGLTGCCDPWCCKSGTCGSC